MKKKINIVLAAMLMILAWSCSKDVMDDINKNINDPTNVSANLIITDAMITSAFSITGSDLAFYASIYMEHNVGVWNQGYSAEIRTGEPISATTYNNSWNTIYNNLYNLKTIIDKCSEDGEEPDNYYTLGIAQTLMAHNLATLTDLMGDVPWSEALQPGFIYTPKLDKQEDIYAIVFNLLDAAIENFNKESIIFLGNQDFIYSGNAASIKNWEKFAYGLKARYTMRLSLKNEQYAKVIEYANKSFASSSEQAQLKYNGSTMISPFYKFFTDRDYFGASTSFYNKLNDRNDPRLDVFWEAHPKADDFLLTPNGSPDQVQGIYAISAISNPEAPTYLLSYHEIEFLKAEAFSRMGNTNDAKDALKKAIVAAFKKVNVGLTADDAEAYFDAEVVPRFNSNAISEIMNQKYFAFFEEEAIEAYNDYRRLRALGNDVIQLANPKNADRFPHRYTYGNSDVTTNFNVREAYGDGSYVFTEKVWWAGGSR